jgi:glucosamine--fructose-6-phosphate aminotransferase (isomerizing)
MTSITETVIRGQFPFWQSALTQALPAFTAKKVVLTGCGSSYYLSQALAATFNAAGVQAVAVPGAEWAERPEAYVVAPEAALVIGLSRSGTTTETVQAIKASRARGWATMAISCEPGSAILDAAEVPFCLPTHPQEGIVMSVSASLMLLGGLRLAGATLSETVVKAAQSGLAQMDAGAKAILKGRSHFVFLGGGALYGIACEGALKLQEMSISYSQAFHPLEYRHGPISLLDEKSVAVMLYSGAAEEEAKVTRDMQSKGAKVIGIGGPGDLRIELGVTGAAAALAALPALQILGEHLALLKGINTESPRNLTKVVVLN